MRTAAISSGGFDRWMPLVPRAVASSSVPRKIATTMSTTNSHSWM